MQFRVLRTLQRIADQAYALFVAQLTAAGYEAVDQTELTRLAPEFGAWATLPNFSQGRFGTYVAPTGQTVRFLQGDAAKRDTSGMFGQQVSVFRVLDGPQDFTRSPITYWVSDVLTPPSGNRPLSGCCAP